MIQVHIWKFRGLNTAMGHASMHVGAEYVSWWPAGENRARKIPGPAGRRVPLYSVAHIQGQSYDDDRYLEDMDPDETIRLEGLDEDRLIAWWRTFNVPGRDWSTLGQNCATTVARGLMIAGADDYALGAAGWWRSWNTVWQPNDVLLYARQVRSGLTTRQGRQPAINLIRRFVTSPLGFTSVTTGTNVPGLAEALYSEASTYTALVMSVLQELDARTNTPTAKVAAAYVDLVMARNGPPRAALALDTRLRADLLRLLDQNRSAPGQQRRIEFIRSLS